VDPITVIEMTAEKYEYTPAEIRVKAGMRVQLKVRALDRDHGLKFKLYPEGEDKKGPAGLRFEEGRNEVRLKEGQVVTVEFVAERPGRYEFECSVFCGLGHHGMDAWLIVER
jgi:cytochrome c oxidase subunit 2